MTSIHDWNTLIEEAETERFIDREQELAAFHEHINRTPPRYLIFYITGQGGVGKTTLAGRCQKTARDLGFLVTNTDERQQDVPMVLGDISEQLALQGFPLKRFEERYRLYRHKRQEIERDPEAPRSFIFSGKQPVRETFLLGDMPPVFPAKEAELSFDVAAPSQAGEWAAYLNKKLTSNDEVELLRDPIGVLTPLFFADLNTIARNQRVLLCFENFEVTRQELEEWLLMLPDYKPSPPISAFLSLDAGLSGPGGRL